MKKNTANTLPAERHGLGITEMIISLVILGTAAGFLVPIFYRLAQFQGHNKTRIECRDQALNVCLMLKLAAQEGPLSEAVIANVEQSVDSARWSVICEKQPDLQDLLGVSHQVWNVGVAAKNDPDTVNVQLTTWTPAVLLEQP